MTLIHFIGSVAVGNKISIYKQNLVFQSSGAFIAIFISILLFRNTPKKKTKLIHIDRERERKIVRVLEMPKT